MHAYMFVYVYMYIVSYFYSFTYFCDPSLLIEAWVRNHLQEHGHLTSGYTPKENALSISSKHELFILGRACLCLCKFFLWQGVDGSILCRIYTGNHSHCTREFNFVMPRKCPSTHPSHLTFSLPFLP